MIAAVRDARTTEVSNQFAAIGRPDAPLPRSRSEAVQEPSAQDRVAFEYWAASLLSQLSDSRRERAKKAAIVAGVLPNFSANPLPIGSATTIYTGTQVSLAVKVVPQADRIDTAGLMADLHASGIRPALLKRLLKKHTRSFPGAHIVNASLI